MKTLSLFILLPLYLLGQQSTQQFGFGTLNDLKTLSISPVSGNWCFLAGQNTTSDGLGGDYYWHATYPKAGPFGTMDTIRPNRNTTDNTDGAWIRKMRQKPIIADVVNLQDSLTNKYTQSQSALRFVSLNGSYSNPSWITTLASGKISGLAVVATSGSYSDLTGKPTPRRIEPYSGTTNASGNYTVTFGTSFSVAPNVQANIINGTNTQTIKITSVSTTAVTVNVTNRNEVLGLLPTYSNVNGASVDIIVTEK